MIVTEERKPVQRERPDVLGGELRERALGGVQRGVDRGSREGGEHAEDHPFGAASLGQVVVGQRHRIGHGFAQNRAGQLPRLLVMASASLVLGVRA